ncbi:MAG: sigma 54-interacting transcriptional regulator [Acidobacteria bacterium]|nr:sigma 54-interacting transcriptional regulator [Acidobacteriota bacterium]
MPDNDRAKLLLEINNAVVSNLDLPALLRAVSICLKRITNHDFAVLFIYDRTEDRLRAHALHSEGGDDTRDRGYLLPVENTVSGTAFKTGQTIVFKRADLEKFTASVMLELPQSARVQTGCCVPLIARGTALGVLTLISFKKNNFTKQDVRLIEQAVGQIAIAVENTLAFEQTKAQNARFEMLLNASNALSAVFDLDEVLKVAAGILRRHVPFEFAGVALYDREAHNLKILALENSPPDFLKGALTLPIEDTPDGLAFRTRRIVRRGRVDFAEFPSPHMRLAFDAGVRSYCCVPLVSRNETIGVLAVANGFEDSLSPEDGETIQMIANQIAGAIETAVQFNEIERLKNQLASEKLYLEEEIQSEYNFAEIVGKSAALRSVLGQIETVAPTDSCVLLYGETGTGKELFSRAIHNLSARRERTMVKLNCSAIPTGLLESELFGHEKGAFTGAVGQRVGRFELAHKGTLLLDEIGDIPLELQPKLLRVLQENEFERLGSSRTMRTDVRLVAATNRNLREMVEEKTFRGDLYYRLNVFPVTIPPLRERREDIPLLAGYFTKKHARRMNKRIETIPREAVDTLCDYSFPGNVRELENFIERAVILTQGEELRLPLSELDPDFQTRSKSGLPVSASLEEVEKNHIAEVLKKTGGKIAGRGGAANVLDLPVSTLRHRMKKLGLL